MRWRGGWRGGWRGRSSTSFIVLSGALRVDLRVPNCIWSECGKSSKKEVALIGRGAIGVVLLKHQVL